MRPHAWSILGVQAGLLDCVGCLPSELPETDFRQEKSFGNNMKIKIGVPEDLFAGCKNPGKGKDSPDSNGIHRTAMAHYRSRKPQSHSAVKFPCAFTHALILRAAAHCT